jgi:hypothetical protein
MEQTNISQINIRPTFLTVLCILSWTGCAITLVMNVFTLILIGTISEVDQDGNPAQSDNKNLSVACIQIAGSILVLVGTILMWKLRKPGFFIYAIAEIAPLIAMFFLLDKIFLLNGITVAYFVLSIVFIALYGLNLKSMK